MCTDVRGVEKVSSRVWNAPLPKRLLRVLFMAFVQGTLYSGLEALVLEDRRYKKLDKVLVGLLRKLCKGKASYLIEGAVKLHDNRWALKSGKCLTAKISDSIIL